jgi:thioredoxin-like negative regulator of GroEL
VRDALGREDWRVAQGFLNRLLDERRSRQDLLDATLVEGGLGNKSAALAYSRELYERDRSNDEGVAAYVSALIDSGRREEAGRLIESGLRAAPAGPVKSRYHYLQSRLRSGEEAALGDLRSSLFEDPRNLDALIAMFEIYRRRKDGSRALYYLKQARAIAPDNSRLRRYEREYAGNE